MNEVIITLTREQAEKLEDVLSFTQDEGPWGEGWQSDELMELCEIVEKALQKGEL